MQNNKYMQKLILSCLLILGFITVEAQQTLIYTHSDLLFDQGKELYNQQKYAASYRNFESFLNSSEKTQAGQRHEAEYYLIANAFELRLDNAFLQIQNFISKNPYTPFLDKTNVMLGTLLYENHDYSGALSYFKR